MDKKILDLRHNLHRYPELSGKEKHTSAGVSSFLHTHTQARIIDSLGGCGVAAVFAGKEPGKTVLFRADLDGLPIDEKTELPYRSQTPNRAHSCGHDGHIGILAALGMLFTEHPPEKGQVVLLFQPAEETGEGAASVIQDPAFSQLSPDFVFALHNIPGYPLHTVILRSGAFASASTGMKILLHGKTSHASEPEKGINPASALAELMKQLRRLPGEEGLATIIFALLGERTLGTSPGNAELITTLRSFDNKNMDHLKRRAEMLTGTIAEGENLGYSISYQDEFPAVDNAEDCVDIIDTVATNRGFAVHHLREPFRWSEDFAHFTARYPGALFGIGAGSDHPPLHSSDYDFPDEIIDTGVTMFYNIYRYIEDTVT